MDYKYKLPSLLLLMALITNSNTLAQHFKMGNAEERTRQKAVDVFTLIVQMEELSAMCNEPIPTIEHPLSRGKTLIKQKLKITFDKMAEIITEETQLMKDIEQQLNDYDCLYYDNKAVLNKLAEDFDMAVFRLDLSRDLDQPIVSQKDHENSYPERLATTIAEHKDHVQTIAVGKLVPASAVPEAHKQQYWQRDSKYWYLFDKGWKTETSKYVPDGGHAYISIDYDEEERIATLTTKQHLYFIDRNMKITAMIEIKDIADIEETLGAPRWFYKGDYLKERRF